MAHIQQLSFIKTIAQHLTSDYSDVKILEIGSYDVNGSVRKSIIGELTKINRKSIKMGKSEIQNTKEKQI